MFPSTKFQSRLRDIVGNANERMNCGEGCSCPMQLRYSEYMMGSHLMCDVLLRISGYIYLYVEGRFMEDKALLTVVNEDDDKQQFMIDNENDAKNMCDVIEQYVDNYIANLVSTYEAA